MCFLYNLILYLYTRYYNLPILYKLTLSTIRTIHHRELQSLVAEGRDVIKTTVTHNQQLIAENNTTLLHTLTDLETQAKLALKEELNFIHTEFDNTASILSILEQIALADKEIVTVLCTTASNTSNNNANNSDITINPSSSKRMLFQSISNNSADYQMIATLLSPNSTTDTTTSSPKKKSMKNTTSTTNMIDSNSTSISGNRESLDRLELTRLYKLVLSPTLGYGDLGNDIGTRILSLLFPYSFISERVCIFLQCIFGFYVYIVCL